MTHGSHKSSIEVVQVIALTGAQAVQELNVLSVNEHNSIHVVSALPIPAMKLA